MFQTVIYYSPEVQRQAQQVMARVKVANLRARILRSYAANLSRRAVRIKGRG